MDFDMHTHTHTYPPHTYPPHNTHPHIEFVYAWLCLTLPINHYRSYNSDELAARLPTFKWGLLSKGIYITQVYMSDFH